MGVSPSIATGALSAGISAGVSLATTAASLWMNSIQLSHNADTATTLIVNGLAVQLQNLVTAYLAEPASCANQRAALDLYDNAWAWLQGPTACGAPSYGSAGNRCISDRAPGGKYPWQTYYRDPIANDPRLSNAACDTGQTLLLPSIGAGYAPVGITSTGGSATTGQTAQQLAAAAVAATTASPALTTPTTTAPLPSSTYLYVGMAALGLLLLVKS